MEAERNWNMVSVNYTSFLLVFHWLGLLLLLGDSLWFYLVACL